MRTLLQFPKLFRKAGAFSAQAFVQRAAFIAVLYSLSELVGLREYTSFISGTSANLGVSWHIAAVFGLIHLLLYVGFILVVPIFLITAGLLSAWERLSQHSK